MKDTCPRILIRSFGTMVSGRALYRQLADASDKNARELLRNAYDLKSVGSRGHACALAVLAMEESAKALIYHIAAEGVVRIVKKNPNSVTTFRESDLLKHEFKHALISSELAHWINYAPFYDAINSITKDRLHRKEVEAMIVRAIHGHRRLQIELLSGGKAAMEAQQVFKLLESLNRRKNDGLYVGHAGRRLLAPNSITRKELKDVLDLADTIVSILSQVIRERLKPIQKSVLMEEMRKSAKQIKRIRSTIASGTSGSSKE